MNDNRNGTLGQLSTKGLKRIRRAMPDTDHWLTRKVTLPLSLGGKRASLSYARLIALAIALIFLAVGTTLDITIAAIGFIAVLGSLVLFLPAPEGLLNGITDLLPATKKYRRARETLQAAADGNHDALAVAITATRRNDGTMQVTMPSLDVSWVVVGKGGAKEAAEEALTKLQS